MTNSKAERAIGGRAVHTAEHLTVWLRDSPYPRESCGPGGGNAHRPEEEEEVALPQRGPDKPQEEMATSQGDLEAESKLPTLQRALVVCLRRCRTHTVLAVKKCPHPEGF